jgi:hypothetical protein
VRPLVEVRKRREEELESETKRLYAHSTAEVSAHTGPGGPIGSALLVGLLHNMDACLLPRRREDSLCPR